MVSGIMIALFIRDKKVTHVIPFPVMPGRVPLSLLPATLPQTEPCTGVRLISEQPVSVHTQSLICGIIINYMTDGPRTTSIWSVVSLLMWLFM